MNNHPQADGREPPTLPLTVRLSRVRSVVECLGDSLTADGDYSPHIARRSETCDLIVHELTAIADAVGECQERK